MRHLITLFDLEPTDIEQIFSITEDLKTKLKKGVREPLLPGRVMALVFEKPSLRTRVSFESAMTHLGGSSIFLGEEVGFGQRESIEDFARVLSEYADVIVVRAKQHVQVEQLAEHSTCSVINGLTEVVHPCQALADLYTLKEFSGPLAGKKLAFIGDGNNVARSLAIACGKTGMRMSLASPSGYEFHRAFLDELRQEVPFLELEITEDPRVAVRDADAVYTDVWASMGQESERAARQKIFAPYQVNAELMKLAPKNARFLHCLPARRGEEVSDEVIDSPQSVVVAQAGNRMHLQKGILAWMLGGKAKKKK